MGQLEKWLQLFDNVLADEAVYITQDFDDTRSSKFLENYINSRFQIEVRLQEEVVDLAKIIGHRLTYRLTYRSCDGFVGSKKFNAKSGTGFERDRPDPSCEKSNRRQSMFIAVPEIMQQSQWAVIRGEPFVRSIEGLYILDDGSDFMRELKKARSDLFVSPRPGFVVRAEWESRFSFSYWKEYVFGSPKLPTDKPQCILNHRTKIVDGVSSSESYLVRYLAEQRNINAYTGIAPRVKLSLGNNTVRVVVEEGASYPLTIVDVLLRPLEPGFNGSVIWSYEQ